MLETVCPLARIAVSVGVEEEPFAVSFPGLVVSVVVAAVGVDHFPDAVTFVVREIAVVDCSVCEEVLSLSIFFLVRLTPFSKSPSNLSLFEKVSTAIPLKSCRFSMGSPFLLRRVGSICSSESLIFVFLLCLPAC